MRPSIPAPTSPHVRALALVLCFGLALSACAAPGAPSAPSSTATASRPTSAASSLVNYPVDRLYDLFDIARAGVCVGPGAGIAVVPTEAAQLALLTRTSVGVGLQSLRHPPVQTGAELLVGVGPLEANPDAGVQWVRSFTDLRLDLHLALVGGYLAVDPVEIVDFVLGFVGVDLRGDD